MPANRMHRGLVTLSASAVAAVYMAGYLRTQSADARIGAATESPPAVASAVAAGAPTAPVVVAPTAAPTSVPRSDPFSQRAGSRSGRGQPAAPATVAPTPVPSKPSSATAPAASTGTYKDGTYTGQGSSRRGDVWVTVQVTGGRIANVSISRSTLQYPVRDIAGLPAQVVERQSAQVDTVSRATYSSQAFRGAVTQALSQAAA